MSAAACGTRIATADEHNTHFPGRPVTVRLLAVDHGLMNLVAAPLGGVSMCRGAGGMPGTSGSERTREAR
jgi:hypothetical protein